MKTQTVATLLGVLLGCIWTTSIYSTQIPEVLDGSWVGEYQVQGKRVYVNVGFKTEKEGIKAVLVAPLENSARQSLTQVRLQDSFAHFELPKYSGALIFEGRLKDGMISGSIIQGELRGAFQLIRIGADDRKTHNQYVGDYHLNSTGTLVIGRDLGQLYYYDPASRRTGVLWSLVENTYFGGPSSGIHFPIDIRVTFVKDDKGEVTGLRVIRNGLPEESAKKVNLYNKEEISFQNGDVTLSGTLKIPAKAGPHPAVVLMHGSNAQSRFGPSAFLEFAADHFARRGIAVLAYDKRGVGASTGNWEKASFDDLAADALAGVQFLKSHKDINPKGIGLWGISQGAWLVELAASRSKDVAFIIPVSGGGVNAELQDIKRTELQMRADGFSEEDIHQAVTLQKLKWRFALTGEGWEEYEVAFQKARDKKWFSTYIGSPSSKDDSGFRFWRSINSFDPVAVLKKVTCPILVVLGERDTITPVPETIANIEKTLKGSTNKNYTIKVFPKGDHTLLEAESGGNKERVYLKKFVPGYFDTMTDWILKQMKVRK